MGAFQQSLTRFRGTCTLSGAFQKARTALYSPLGRSCRETFFSDVIQTPQVAPTIARLTCYGRGGISSVRWPAVALEREHQQVLVLTDWRPHGLVCCCSRPPDLPFRRAGNRVRESPIHPP